VLVLGELAGARNGSGWFAPKDLTELFEGFRIPSPGNVSQDLSRLRRDELVTVRPAKPSWSLTPEGHETVAALIGEVDLKEVLAELDAPNSAELGNVQQTVIPPVLAPLKWREPITRMLAQYEFDTNVFCMTRFPEGLDDKSYLDPVAQVIPAAKDALAEHGLTLHLASARQLDDDLYANIAAHMWACRYGIGLFEDRAGRGLNENMIIEVGSMVMTGRRCALLKDETIEKLPTDFVGQIYKPVNFTDLESVSSELHRWVTNDLGLCS
jgi:DNA-binding PadR family transcriptional regulator